MALTVDLNADMGEGIGQDALLLDVVTSANICCGLHAGSPQVMADTMEAAMKRGVGIGAHPGFDDRANFGRTRMALGADDLASLIRYQVGAAKAVADGLGTRLDHLKLHGAMANMATEDVEFAETAFRAALQVAPEMKLMVIAATAQQTAAEKLGVPFIGEIFADRAYNDDATLVDRKLDGAVIHDPEFASKRVLAMLEAGAIISASGKHIPTRIDTVCLHGDTTEALEMARTLRTRLTKASVTIQRAK